MTIIIRLSSPIHGRPAVLFRTKEYRYFVGLFFGYSTTASAVRWEVGCRNNSVDYLNYLPEEINGEQANSWYERIVRLDF